MEAGWLAYQKFFKLVLPKFPCLFPFILPSENDTTFTKSCSHCHGRTDMAGVIWFLGNFASYDDWLPCYFSFSTHPAHTSLLSMSLVYKCVILRWSWIQLRSEGIFLFQVWRWRDLHHDMHDLTTYKWGFLWGLMIEPIILWWYDWVHSERGYAYTSLRKGTCVNRQELKMCLQNKCACILCIIKCVYSFWRVLSHPET